VQFTVAGLDSLMNCPIPRSWQTRRKLAIKQVFLQLHFRFQENEFQIWVKSQIVSINLKFQFDKFKPFCLIFGPRTGNLRIHLY